MGALENNISLVEVDLTQNLIGTAESFKVCAVEVLTECIKTWRLLHRPPLSCVLSKCR